MISIQMWTYFHVNQIVEESYQRQIENPLLGFIDSITLEQVEQPCISPYGHVLGYVYQI